MSSDDTRFHHLADAVLAHILDVVDEAAGDEVDADIQAEILTIVLPDRRQYIINKNAHLSQIWLSSPASGAWHFQYVEAAGAWLSTRGGGESLLTLLAAELSAATGVVISL
ncbi:MAG TPA: iron donor protein CyaY [Candidatus Sulfotelmatobacter sp.]|jgi:frataxin|nr:iron donor protein CyaY [Candidatus Sulfotelmatobacter sp.]